MKSLSQRFLLGLWMVLGAAGIASAQSSGELRWRASGSPLGLQAGGNDWRAPCGSIAFGCEDATSTVRLYESTRSPRSLSLQIGLMEDVAPALRLARPQGLNVSVIGRADIAPALGVYGRLGTTSRAGLAGTAGEGGITYGVGLSWDFSRRGSAMLGWDTYDFRALGGEARDVRATSLGLKWRY